ncbi:MAG: hypothetical protein RR846_09285 [Oscillospiraceae bacterium]
MAVGHVPPKFIGKVVRIKNNLTAKFITYDGAAHPQTPGKKVTTKVKITDDSSQLWKFVEFEGNKYCLVPFADNARSIGIIDVFNNCAVYENIDMPRQASVVDISEQGENYSIKFVLQDKFLSTHQSGGELFLTGSNEVKDLWNIEIATDYKLVNNWLRLYYNPQNRPNARNVEIPDYAYKKANGEKVYSFEVVNSFNKTITYSFNDKKYWFAKEGIHALNGKAVEYYGKEVPAVGSAVSSNLDTKGYHYVAVGPNVVFDNYPASGTPGEEMYGKGTVDAVLKDENNNIYYIHCVVGDIKAHTWNNGVIQSWYKYFNPNTSVPDPTDPVIRADYMDHADDCNNYNITNWNQSACIEFIGDNIDIIGLESYSIEKIISYVNQIN